MSAAKRHDPRRRSCDCPKCCPPGSTFIERERKRWERGGRQGVVDERETGWTGR